MVLSKTSSSSLFDFDVEVGCGGMVAGADEVGRGCLAGPLVIAAVAFDYRRQQAGKLAGRLAGIADSKKLTVAQRQRLYPLIIRYCAGFSLIIASNRTIDEQGLHHTNLRALGQSLDALPVSPKAALVDGRQRSPATVVPHEPLIGGDTKSACIAAASVLAKVTRDRLMRALHDHYPEYGFDRHVGYATKEHRRAIEKHGFCSLHRRSFSTGWADGKINDPQGPQVKGP